MMVVLFHGQPNVQGREQREHIRLNTRHQQLNQIDEQHHQACPKSNHITLKNKRQRNQREDYNMTCGDGHKQTHRQGMRRAAQRRIPGCARRLHGGL